MTTKKPYFFIVFIYLIISCTKEKQYKVNSIESFNVKLVKHKSVGPFPTILRPFSNEYLLLPNFNGIPEADSLSLQGFKINSSNSTKDLERLLDENKIDSSEFKKLNLKLYAISAIIDEKQIIILDKNNNYDFSDDEKMVFDKNLNFIIQKNYAARDSFPYITLKHQEYFNEKVFDRELDMRLMPYRDYFIVTEKSNYERDVYIKLQLVAAVDEYRTGNFKIGNNEFKIGTKTHRGKSDFIFQEKDKPFYSRRNKDKEYEEFKEGDTVQLGTHFIKIDSVGADLDKLYLQKLDITELPNGYKDGQQLRDYTFTDIEGNIQTMSTLLKNKDYLLIDFWGTWCVPCLQLTPDLKRIHQEYPHIAILGVDFDFEKEPGVKYIKEKELDWTHVFIERVRKDTLLHKKLVGKLRVDNYPTFILIDKDLKIVYRGIGKKALNAIEELIVVNKALKEQ